MHAARWARVKAIPRLVVGGADVDALDEHGVSALWLALNARSFRGREAVRALLGAGAVVRSEKLMKLWMDMDVSTDTGGSDTPGEFA
ncbi:hypothetical protein BDV19DRAFT_48990 [Aspergillus venezuelensis]